MRSQMLYGTWSKKFDLNHIDLGNICQVSTCRSTVPLERQVTDDSVFLCSFFRFCPKSHGQARESPNPLQINTIRVAF
jgi:hypothetical protein